ncbi:hypothetical protein NQ317_006012, partial [Molorchus minor]
QKKKKLQQDIEKTETGFTEKIKNYESEIKLLQLSYNNFIGLQSLKKEDKETQTGERQSSPIQNVASTKNCSTRDSPVTQNYPYTQNSMLPQNKHHRENRRLVVIRSFLQIESIL